MADLRNRRNVLVGAPDVQAAGGITIGPALKTSDNFPTDASKELDASLKHVAAGYVSEDGVTKTVDRSTEKIKDWHGDTMVITQSDHSVTLQLTFMEGANGEVLKMIAGENNVTVSDNTVRVVDNADELPHRSLAFYIKGGNGARILVFAPDVQVTEVGDVSYVRSGVVKYQATLECFGVDNTKLISLIKRADDEGVAVAGGAEETSDGRGEEDSPREGDTE